MKKYVIFDMDETLTMFRQHKADLLPTDGVYTQDTMCAWKEECAHDVPNVRMVDMYLMYQMMGYTMVILTARGNDVRVITDEWCDRYGITYDLMIMRTGEQDGWSTATYKEWAVNTYLDGAWDDIEIMVDDHDGVCAMFNAHGVATITPPMVVA